MPRGHLWQSALNGYFIHVLSLNPKTLSEANTPRSVWFYVVMLRAELAEAAAGLGYPSQAHLLGIPSTVGTRESAGKRAKMTERL